MSSAVIQLLVLAGIAVFLIVRLKNVLGTRDGFEKPPTPVVPSGKSPSPRHFEVIDGGIDKDITDQVSEDSDAAKAFAAMKRAEPGFLVRDFIEGARGAYEMILIAFEKGDLSEGRKFISDDVAASFQSVFDERAKAGLHVEAKFIGLREIGVKDAHYDHETHKGEISVRYVSEITSVVRNTRGDLVEGSPTEIRRQYDTWTFARKMGVNDPNWQLVATGD